MAAKPCPTEKWEYKPTKKKLKLLQMFFTKTKGSCIADKR